MRWTCPKCKRAVTVYVGKSVPVCSRCRKRMERMERKPKSKTA
jgi:ribosomal protein L37AE/L43A